MSVYGYIKNIRLVNSIEGHKMMMKCYVKDFQTFNVNEIAVNCYQDIYESEWKEVEVVMIN